MTDINTSHPLLAALITEPALPPQVAAIRGGANGKPTTPAEARELASIALQLQGAPARSETERFGAAALCQGLPRGNGSREVFLKLARQPELWSRLDHSQRGLLARTLGKAKTSVEAAKLGKAYAKILPDVLFENARPEGKKNALTQPMRALQVVHDMSFRSHHLSGDRAQMRAVAEHYANIEWNTPDGRKHLATQISNVANEVLTRAFEDRAILKEWTGGSEWIGERFTGLSGGDTFASAAHKYMKARITEDHCGLFQGDRSHCAKRSVP